MSEDLRVVVTRTTVQAGEFSARLRAAGFTPVEFPAIRLAPLPCNPLGAAIANFSGYDWLIFTSGNAVEFFFRCVDELGAALLEWPEVAAVGSATAEKLAERGVSVAFMPSEFVGEELVLGLGDLSGKKVLLPRAKIGRPEIADLLKARGANLVEVPLYDTVTAVPDAAAFAALNAGFDALTFTSPSSVRNFFKLVSSSPGMIDRPIEKLLDTVPVVCIGPVTARAAAAAGLTNILVPEEYTIEAMVGLLTAVLSQQKMVSSGKQGAER